MTDVTVRAGVVAGIAGPAAFTGAWIVSSLRQTGHPAAVLQISGLAAGAGVTGALLIAFAAATSGPAAGIVQRAAVTVPLAALTAMAARLASTAREAGRDCVRTWAGTRTGPAGCSHG